LRIFRLAVWLLVATAISVAGTFYARSLSRADAEHLSQHFAEELPRVTIYSQRELSFVDSDVRVSTLQGQGASVDLLYKFSYDGFFVLKRSESQWFLLTAAWKRANGGRVYVVDNNSAIRVEFPRPN
jgi:hypothetical protein